MYIQEDAPNITSIKKCYRNQDYCQPYSNTKSGNMTGFKQCITINSDGGKYDETVKAVAMEADSEVVADERPDSVINGIKMKGLEQIMTFFRKGLKTELSFNLHDSPDDQKPKQYYIDCIEILFKECTTSGGTYICNACIVYAFYFGLWIAYCVGHSNIRIKILYLYIYNTVK